MLKIILLALFLTKSKCHTPVNGSEIIIYGDHSDLHRDSTFILTTNKPTISNNTTMTTAEVTTENSDDETEHYLQHDKDDVVLFVPTESPVYRNMDAGYNNDDSVRLSDVFDKKISSVVKETESPQRDILFISGKNSEYEKSNPKDTEPHSDTRRQMDDSEKVKKKKARTVLNCRNLDCDNTVENICGGKLEGKQWKYRLFLNDCYFRKVNCGFTYEISRYIKVDISYCGPVIAHSKKKMDDQVSYPMYIPMPEKPSGDGGKNVEIDGTRRFSGRRAMTMNMGASYCAHMCPTTCTEEYEPECALSATGERRVFANHCLLDHHSCTYQMMWRRRPLSECVGGKKADMRQNRGFISWMQRVGIVDTKGKLVLQ